MEIKHVMRAIRRSQSSLKVSFQSIKFLKFIHYLLSIGTNNLLDMIDGGIEGVTHDDSEDSTSFKLMLGRMRREKLLEQIEKKNFVNDLLVPYSKLNKQIKPEDRINASLESRFCPKNNL